MLLRNSYAFAMQFLATKKCKAALLALAIGAIFHLWPMPKINNEPLSTLLLSREGILLNAQVAEDQQWRFAPVEQLPSNYEIALITFEDQHFYKHPGINPLAIARAIYGNIKKDRIVSGGSTLTMQLARMLRHDPARTYTNKIIEILLALKLEWHLSKQSILIHYANHAP